MYTIRCNDGILTTRLLVLSGVFYGVIRLVRVVTRGLDDITVYLISRVGGGLVSFDYNDLKVVLDSTTRVSTRRCKVIIYTMTCAARFLDRAMLYGRYANYFYDLFGVI